MARGFDFISLIFFNKEEPSRGYVSHYVSRRLLGRRFLGTVYDPSDIAKCTIQPSAMNPG